MTEIIAIANQKGGVGKSTTADALAWGLATFMGRRVLLIDLDQQTNLTLFTGADTAQPTIYDVITGRTEIQKSVQKLSDKVHFIAASGNLAFIDKELSNAGKDKRLKIALEPIAGNYDYIVIDTPPALNIVTINALTAAQRLIIPAQADIASLQGIGQIYADVMDIQKFSNPTLRLAGILLTRYNGRNIITRDMTVNAQKTAERVGTFVYTAVIRECVVFKEAQAVQKPIYEKDPTSIGCLDYRSFVTEFTDFLKKRGNK